MVSQLVGCVCVSVRACMAKQPVFVDQLCKPQSTVGERNKLQEIVIEDKPHRPTSRPNPKPN